MDKSWAFLFLGLGFLLGIFVWNIIRRLFAGSTVVEKEFINDPDNEYVKWVTHTHGTLIELLLNTLANAWFIDDADIKKASSTQTDINTELVVLAYYNYMFRFYTNWNKKKVTIGFTTNREDKHFTAKKSFKLENGCVNYEKLYVYLVKLYKKYYSEPEGSGILTFSQDAVDYLIKEVCKGKINGKDLDLNQYWTDWYNDIVENGASSDDIANFLCYTAALRKSTEEVIEK